jgi:hypothetical protein
MDADVWDAGRSEETSKPAASQSEIGPFFASMGHQFCPPFLSVGWFFAVSPHPRLSLVILLLGMGAFPLIVRGQVPDSLARAADSTDERRSVVARRVAGALSEGDANRLLRPSADRVEISLFGARTFYSSAQALYVLRKFFRSHAPRRFVIGDVMETGTSCFVRGEYEQARIGRRLQVYVRLDRSERKSPWRLREIRIRDASE